MPTPRASLTALALDLCGDEPSRPELSAVLAACPPGQLRAARAGDEPVVVVRLFDGRAAVYRDACPHDGGLLSDGFVEDDRIVCARHGWEFEACSGRCPARRRRGGSPASRLRWWDATPSWANWSG